MRDNKEIFRKKCALKVGIKNYEKKLKESIFKSFVFLCFEKIFIFKNWINHKFARVKDLRS